MAQTFDINLLLEYTTDSVTWIPIISGLGANYGIGSYVWDIPDVTSNTVHLRFTNLTDGVILDSVGPLNLVSTTSITNLIRSVEEVDEQLNKIIDWANSISWCSRAVLETFKNYDLISSENRSLVLNEYGQLTIPDGAISNNTYIAYTPIITFEPDKTGESVPLESMTTRWSAQYKVVTYGEASVKIELCTNPNDSDPVWFVLYDDTIQENLNAPLTEANRANTVDKSYDEITDLDPLIFPTNAIQVRYTIKTDSLGNGGHINYFALLGNPSLF